MKSIGEFILQKKSGLIPEHVFKNQVTSHFKGGQAPSVIDHAEFVFVTTKKQQNIVLKYLQNVEISATDIDYRIDEVFNALKTHNLMVDLSKPCYVNIIEHMNTYIVMIWFHNI